MITLLRSLKSDLRQLAQRKKFPHALLHADVILDGQSTLGRHTVLFSGVNISASSVGSYTYLQAGTRVNGAEIGPFCSIAAEVVIGLIDHPTSFISTSPVFYDNRQPLPRFFVDKPLASVDMPKTVIEADTWIGQRAMIKAGVHIGVGAIIGAGAIVTRDVPPYAIVTGIPARPMRKRFSEEVCERLLATQWWTREDDELQRLREYFSNPDKFAEQLEKR